MNLGQNETKLVGKWVEVNGQTSADSVAERIKRLTSQHLKKIAVSKHWGAWEILFQDPDDGRYWEQTYPEGEMHGGGPPTLTCISKEEAQKKYGEVV